MARYIGVEAKDECNKGMIHLQGGERAERRMNETDGATGKYGEPGRYAIRIKGHLDDRWAGWFDGLTITLQEDGTTLLTGPVADQTALHGLLRKVRDVGLPLVSVLPVDPK